MAKRPPTSRRVTGRSTGAEQASPGAGAAKRARPTRKPKSSTPEPSDVDIRLRAYHLFLDRGGRHGGQMDDWLRAEEELKTTK
jgi:hypothetical protein